MDLRELQQYFEARQSRRKTLQQLGALASVGLIVEACSTNPTAKKSDRAMVTYMLA